MFDILCFFVYSLFLSLLIVPCLSCSHLSSTLFGAIIAFSNVLRMKLLGKAVSFDSLSYSLISFHMLTYFHMLLGFFFDFICVANALGCRIWIAWYQQSVNEHSWCFICFKMLLHAFVYASMCFLFCFSTLFYVFMRFHTLLNAFIHFYTLLNSFICFHTLLNAFICFHTLSYTFIRFLYALICFYYAFTCSLRL